MQIESSKGNNCVNRAFSTMRAALSLDPLLPFKMMEGNTKPLDIVRECGKCFPECDVYIWCSKNSFVNCELNVHYCGEWYHSTFDDASYIIAFSYCSNDGLYAHLVIGQPVLYDNMEGSICIAVKRRE